MTEVLKILIRLRKDTVCQTREFFWPFRFRFFRFLDDRFSRISHLNNRFIRVLRYVSIVAFIFREFFSQKHFLHFAKFRETRHSNQK